MHKVDRHFIRSFPVRAILASIILCAVVAVVLPLSPVSATSACQLDCCAGRAPHALGSCMTGACHARIKIKRHAHVRFASSSSNEELCGLSARPAAVARRLSASNISAAQRTTNSKSTQSELSVTSTGRQCPEDCGGLASVFSTGKQSRKLFLRGEHDQRPQSATELGYLLVQSVKSRPGLSRRSIPRGPPLSLA